MQLLCTIEFFARPKSSHGRIADKLIIIVVVLLIKITDVTLDEINVAMIIEIQVNDTTGPRQFKLNLVQRCILVIVNDE